MYFMSELWFASTHLAVVLMQAIQVQVTFTSELYDSSTQLALYYTDNVHTTFTVVVTVSYNCSCPYVHHICMFSDMIQELFCEVNIM